MTALNRLLILSLLFLSHCSGNHGEDSIYLIPANYEGPVLIVFNQPDGDSIEYENTMRIYRISNNGIQRTQFKPNFGIQKHYFFTEDSLKKRKSFRYLNQLEYQEIDKSSNEIVCWNQESGTSYGVENEKTHFELMTICKVKNLDSISEMKSAFVRENISGIRQ